METLTKKPKTIKEFSHNEKTFLLTEYTARTVKEAKFAYSKRFTECIREKFFTRKGLENELIKEDPEFFTAYRERRQELIENIADTESLLDRVDDPDELTILSQMLLLYRADLFQQDRMVNELFGNTADQLADEERILHILVGAIKNTDLTPVWDSYEDLMSEPDSEFVEICKYQIMCAEYNLDPDWQEKLPEVKVQDKILKLQEEKKQAESKKPAAKKKTTRKKTSTKKKTTRKRRTTKAKKDVEDSATAPSA